MLVGLYSYYQAPTAIQKVQTAVHNESKLLIHQNGDFICKVIFNMAQLHYQIPYINCTPPKTVVFNATWESIFHVMQQLNFTTRELIFDITLKDKAKRVEHKPNLDPT